MSKKCAICGEKVGFSLGKFISEKYVCNACYELNEKNKSSVPQNEDKDMGSNMGKGLSLMAEAIKKKDIL